MKKKLIRISILIYVCALTAIGCNKEISDHQSGGDEEIMVLAPTAFPEPTLEEETKEYEEALPEISDQAYISKSKAYKVFLPKGWNCSETGVFQVNCQAPDHSAALQARITATGYELNQKAFLSFAHAELVHAYSEIKEYEEIEREEEEDQLKSVSTWRDGEFYWMGTDWFIKTNGTVFHLKAFEMKSLNGKYTNLIASVAESIEIIPAALQGAQLYTHRVTHTAPEAFFDVEVPTSWGRYLDASAVKNTIIEGFVSPDQRAAVQIAVYNRGSLIEQKLKAEKTLDIMRAQYGYDLRVSHDKALQDGRERLAWYAENKGVEGISFFDSYANSLYVFSIVWEEPTAFLYQSLLEEIAGSFKRE